MLHPDPIILFGAPRSGTTYLRTVLGAHPDVHITHETRVFTWVTRMLQAARTREMLVNTQRDRFLDHLHAELPGLIRRFYAPLAGDSRHWGDKNPFYGRDRACLNTIRDLFPGTRFVHIIRDGRDVVASLLRKRKPDGSPWTDLDGAHTLWTKHVEVGTRFGRDVGAAAYLEVRYEDLVADDVGVAGTILEFLGAGAHPAVARYCARQRRERTPLSGPTTDVDTAPDRRRSGWYDLLTPEQQVSSLDRLGALLVRHGYETAASLDRLRRQVGSGGVTAGRSGPA